MRVLLQVLEKPSLSQHSRARLMVLLCGRLRPTGSPILAQESEGGGSNADIDTSPLGEGSVRPCPAVLDVSSRLPVVG